MRAWYLVLFMSLMRASGITFRLRAAMPANNPCETLHWMKEANEN
jgi:hypothetical protein